MDKIAEFTLPYPPSVNHYYSRSSKGVFINKAARLYREEVVLTLKNKITEKFGDDLVQVELHIHSPDKRKRDIDNILKCVLDVIQMMGVYNDDSQIAVLLVRKMEIVKKGKVFAIIQNMPANHN